MKSKIFSLLVVGLLVLQFQAKAFVDTDSIYTIQLGIYDDSKQEDFDKLKNIGFVFTPDDGKKQQRIIMGIYTERSVAEGILEQVQGEGFKEAFMIVRPAGKDKVYVLQLSVERFNKKVDWKKYFKSGNVYVQPTSRHIKILSGAFKSREQAVEKQKALVAAGFEDAFPKKVLKNLIHQVGLFETGMESEASAEFPSEEATVPTEVPDKEKTESTAKGKSNVKRPKLNFSEVPSSPMKRKSMKRSSVVELQKILKDESAYSSAVDGLYGKGTSAGVEMIMQSNRRYANYKILSAGLKRKKNKSDDLLNQLLRKIDSDPLEAAKGLKQLNHPVGNAYLAYMYFTDELKARNKTRTVNDLMNGAIKETFVKNKYSKKPRFDFKATYDYKDLGQLIQHLRYIQGGQKEEPEVPCWLFVRHPKEAGASYLQYWGSKEDKFAMEDCDCFGDWPEIQMLQTISDDLNPMEDNAKLLEDQNKEIRMRNLLYISPKPFAKDKVLAAWNKSLWEKMDDWAKRDMLHAKMVTPLKIAYYQSMIKLEDYYMDKGYSLKDANTMAMRILQTYVKYPLRAYLK